jgi:signal transduction histidine kinase
MILPYIADSVPATVVETPALVQRLNDAASVAGRLAHDFDNVLMGVMGFAELAQTELAPASPAASYITELLRVASSAQEITRQLHRLHSCDRSDRSPTHVAEVCRSEALATAADVPSNVRVEFDISDDLPAVAVAAEPIRMILSQLIRNAAEAMPGRGPVTVSARLRLADDGIDDTFPAPLPAGDYVELTVADRGPGIQSDILARVGREPFVTTKSRHRGLGLPTVARALHAHGGGLRIESSTRGTAIHAYLPSADISLPAEGRSAVATASLEVVPT